MGREAWIEGSCYSGGFAHGLRSGYGVYSHCASNELCEMLSIGGEDKWQHGWWSTMPYSQKWATEKAGWIYAGQMHHGVRHGFGALASGGGELYEGQFNEDKKHGFGVRMVHDRELWFETYENGVCRIRYSPLKHEELTVSVEASLDRICWSEATLSLSWRKGAASITVFDNKTTLPMSPRAMISDVLSLKIGDPISPSFILQYRDHSDSADGRSVKRTLEIQAGSEATFRLLFLALRLVIHEHRAGESLSAPGAEWIKNLNGMASVADDAQGPCRPLGRFVRGSDGVDERFFKKVRGCVAKADHQHRHAFYYSCLSCVQMTISASAHWHTFGGVGHDAFPHIEDLCQWLKEQSNKISNPDDLVSQIMIDRVASETLWSKVRAAGVILRKYLSLADSKIYLDEQKLLLAEASNDEGFGRMCEARLLALYAKKRWASELISVLEQNTQYIEGGLLSFTHLRFTSSDVDDYTASADEDSSLSDAEISTPPAHRLIVSPTTQKTASQSETQSPHSGSLSSERSSAIGLVSPRDARTKGLELSSSPSPTRYPVQDMTHSVTMNRSTIKTAKLLHCRRHRAALNLDYEEAETLLADSKAQLDQWLAAQRVVTVELRKRAEIAEVELSKTKDVYAQTLHQMEEVLNFNENLLQRYARFRERTIMILDSQVRYGCQRLAFLKWNCWVQQCTKMVCIEQNVVRRWRRIQTSGAFASWQYSTMCATFQKMEKDLTHQRGLVAYLSNKAKEAARCVLHKWVKRPITKCFCIWAAAVHHAVNLKAKGLTVLVRWTGMCMKVSFASWKEVAQHEIRLFRISSRIVARSTHGVNLDSFVRWHILAVENREVRLKAISVVRRMKNSTVYKALAKWEESAKEVRRQRRLLQRAHLRMKRAGMFAAFARWQENIREKKAMVTKSSRVLMRWRKQAAVRCLGVWRRLTAEEVQKGQMMGQIIRRMLHRSLSLAMDLWQHNVQALKQEQAEEGRRQDIMLRIVKRMLNQAKALAFEQWKATVCELARQHGIMERILRRMLNRKMSAGKYLYACACSCMCVSVRVNVNSVCCA